VIHFNLCCTHGHRFDGWFCSNEDFEKQRANGLVTCPVCDSSQIEKALMTPALRNKDRQDLALMQRWQEVARKIREKSEYVGKNFADEARKIHFGEAKTRPIYGEARGEEIVGLLEDGVEVVPLPPLPEKQN